MKDLTPAQIAWLDQYSKAEPVPQSTIEWIHRVAGTNSELRKIIQKFPPSCVVLAKQDLGCPRSGHLGIVVNMGFGYDPETKSDTIQLKVIEVDVPGVKPVPFAGMCDPKWLKVVGYWKGLTPKVVKSIIESHDN